MIPASDPSNAVTPFVGVWIEIDLRALFSALLIPSLPSWECGLKFLAHSNPAMALFVTPFVGVWIEMWSTDTSWQ